MRRSLVVGVLAVLVLSSVGPVIDAPPVSAQVEPAVEVELVDPGPLPAVGTDVVPVMDRVESARDGRVGAGGVESERSLVEDPPVREVVGERTASTESWRTADGDRVLHSYPEAQYFEPAKGEGFVPIDNTLVVDPKSPGWLVNAGNAWQVRFAPTADAGVEYEIEGHAVRVVPEAAGKAKPAVVGTESKLAVDFGVSVSGNQVVYPEVWPGVDVRYTVTNSAVKEELIVKTSEALAARSTYGFTVEGGTVSESGKAAGWRTVEWAGRDQDGLSLQFPPPMVLTKDGGVTLGRDTKAAIDTALLAKAMSGADRTRLDVSVDPGWLAAQGGELPVVIDPAGEVSMPTTSWQSYGSGGGVLGTSYGQAVGNSMTFGANDYWRHVSQFDLSTIKNAGGRVFSARVDQRPISTHWSPSTWPINLASGFASAWAFGGAAPGHNWSFPGGPVQNLVGVGDGPGGQACYGNGCLYLEGGNYGRVWLGELIDWFVAPNGGNVNWAAIGTMGDEGWSGVNTFRESQETLWVGWDVPTPASVPVSPEDQATIATTTQPTLTTTAVGDADPEDNPAWYRFVVSQSPQVLTSDYRGRCNDPASQVASSGWTQSTSWQVPAGVLRDGMTYYWGVISSGAWPSWTTCSAAPFRRFKIDRRLGASTISPTETVGPVTVNLATGNAVVSAGSKTVNTLGGGIGVGFTYNSQQPPNAGLRGKYWWDADHSGSYTAGDQLSMERVDPGIDFQWGTGGPTNATDWFWVDWSGYITAPNSGYYEFGGDHDDNLWINVGGTAVYGAGCCASDAYGSPIWFNAGETKRINVTFLEGGGNANVTVQARLQGSGAQSRLHETFALSTTPDVLSTGWRASLGAGDVADATVGEKSVVITYDDGSTEEFVRDDTSPNIYKPPAGSADLLTRTSDGHLQLVTPTVSYEFDTEGRVLSVASVADDRQPAATSYTWTTYGAVPYVTVMTDPVSGRTVTLTYSGFAGSGTCSTPPTGFDNPAPPGQLCKITYWDNSTTDLHYLGRRLARIVNPGGETTDFGYDASNRLSAIRDPLAYDANAACPQTPQPPPPCLSGRPDDATVRTIIGYDAGGRVSQVQLPQPNAAATPARPSTSFDYDSAPNPPADGVTRVHAAGLAEPNGYARAVNFDASYRHTKTYDVLGQVTSQTWDGATDRISYVDTPDGMRTSTIYETDVKFNTAGKPKQTWGPAPQSWFSGASPTGGHGVEDMPYSVTNYDEGIVSLAGTYWDNATFAGPPKLHSTGVGGTGGNIDRDWTTTNPIPADATPADWSVQLNGWINLAAVGTYSFGVWGDGGVMLAIDDKQLFNTLDSADSSGFISSGNTFNNTTPGKHRITLRYAQKAGGANLRLTHLAPGGSWVVTPGSTLSPDLGLVTSTAGPSPTGSGEVATTTEYTDPHLGMPTKVTVDPAGAKLIDAYSYEAQGTGSYLRKKTHTLPAGFDASGNVVYEPGSMTVPAATVTYGHYGATEAGPTTTGCSGVAANQAGLPKSTTAADPDGTGPAAPILREVAYDVLGRPVASRVVGDSAWSCTGYDTRGRATSRTSPAFTNPADSALDTAARTVTTDFSVGGNPLISENYDTLTTSAGRTKSRTTVDLLGRVTDYVDEWNFKTHTDFDQVGRVTTVTVKNPSNTTVETVAYTYQSSGNGVNQLSTISLDGVVKATVSYDSLGRQSSVAYGNGVTKTAPTYDAFGRANLVEFKNGATLITSDQVAFDGRTGKVVDQVVDGVDANTGGANYTYDSVGRLTSWWARDPGSAKKYNGTMRFDGYDSPPGCASVQAGRNSNRLQQRLMSYNSGGTLLADETARSCYDNADRLTSFTPASGTNPFSGLTYDLHGNTVVTGAETHGYDAADRHLVTKKSASDSIVYTRDAADRIIQRSVAGTVISRFVHTGATDNPGLNVSSTNGIFERLLQLPGGVLLTKRGSSEVWSHPNHHGDLIAWTDATGAKPDPTMAFDPFGNALGNTSGVDAVNGAMDYTWHGAQQRPTERQAGYTKLIEMGARQYSQVLGRFLEVDPIEGGTDNDYAYPADPLNSADLDGSSAFQSYSIENVSYHTASSWMIEMYIPGFKGVRPVTYEYRNVIKKARVRVFVHSCRSRSAKCLVESYYRNLYIHSTERRTVIGARAAPGEDPTAPGLYLPLNFDTCLGKWGSSGWNYKEGGAAVKDFRRLPAPAATASYRRYC